MAKYYKTKIINGNILALEFTKSIPMTLMFMRFQEYSEGIKKVRDRNPMPEGDVMYHYFRKTKKIYHKAGWAGFNIRGDLFYEFINKSSGMPLSRLENKLITVVRNEFGSQFDRKDHFFIIAYMKGDKATKKHELLHALYYLNRQYREIVDWRLRGCRLKKAKKYLKKLGYGFSGKHGHYILIDEIQAYVLSDTKKTIKQFGLSSKTLRQLKGAKKEYY